MSIGRVGGEQLEAHAVAPVGPASVGRGLMTSTSPRMMVVPSLSCITNGWTRPSARGLFVTMNSDVSSAKGPNVAKNSSSDAQRVTMRRRLFAGAPAALSWSVGDPPAPRRSGDPARSYRS
ncbi:MAG: hypothetical protein R3F14_39825 [Polyangiaceae bacterium]